MTSAGLIEQLAQEIQELRAELAALKTGRSRVTLRPLGAQPFLGQALTVEARVTDPGTGRARIDVPVTFVASWGILNGTDGYARKEGTTITLRTGSEGTATVNLKPPVSEDLLDSQQSSLQAQLLALDPNAPAPRDTRQGLEIMAREYRWEANLEFRQALDIYFRDFGARVQEALDVRDYLASWNYVDAAIHAYAREDEAGDLDTIVQGSAVLDVRFKDWLGAWLTVLRDVAVSESPLPNRLDNLKKLDRSAGALLDGVYEHAHNYVAEQFGRAGEFIGQKVAEQSVRTFLDTGIADLDTDTKVAVTPGLDLASGALGKGNLQVLTAVGQARTDLRKEIETGSAKLAADVLRVEAGLATKVATDDFQQFRTNVDSSLATKLNSDTFSAFESQVTTRMTQVDATLAVKIDRATLDAVIAGKADLTFVDTALAAKPDRSELDERLAAKIDQAALDTAIAGKADLTFVDTALAAKPDRSEFDEKLAAKIDQAALDTAIAGKADLTFVDTALAAKPDRTEFDEKLAAKIDQAALDTAIASKADLTFVDTALAAKPDRSEFDERLASKIDQATLDTAIAGKADLTFVDTALAAKPDRSELDERLAAKIDQAALETAIAGKADRAELDQKLAGKLDQAVFAQALAGKADRSELDQRLSSKLDTTAFDSFAGGLDQRLAAKVDAGALNAALANKLDTAQFQVFQRGTDDRLRQQQAKIDDLATRKLDVARFDQLSTQVTRIDETTTRINNKVTGIEGRLPPIIFRPPNA